MARADLHTHSRYSDGILPPAALVGRAAANGVETLALTDHDSTAGLAEAVAAGARQGVRIIPGVELSTDLPDGQDAHLLGYFPSAAAVADAAFQAQLARYRVGREQRGRTILEKLAALGCPLDWERVRAIAGEAAVGRPHVALALVERGYVASVREAFDRFLHNDGPADAPRDKLPPAAAIRLIRSIGGIAVLAHPLTLRDWERVLVDLLALGVQGVETYYKRSTPEEIARVRAVVGLHRMLPTGGSDFHGLHDDECDPGQIPFPDEAVQRFLHAADAQWALYREAQGGTP